MSRWTVWSTSRRLILPILVVTGLGWAVVRVFGEWRHNAELGRAQREVSAGQYDLAQARLARLAARRPGDADVEYTLGVCEASLGHVEAALAAWGRVPHDSAIAPRAAVSRAGLAIDHGRLSVAEESLGALANSSGEIGREARRLADQVDLYLGRVREIARRIERWWPTARNQAAQLRMHWLLDAQPLPVEPVREALERMGREAPDDDRVWLARANLATRTGLYDEADAWLTRCEARRNDDPEVLRARLTWALDTRRADVATRTAARLKTDELPPEEVLAIAARLAELRGDHEAERRALERRVAQEPGDSAAWGRLADLAAREGRLDALKKAQERKAEIDRAKDRYRMLIGGDANARSSTPDLTELAKTAEALGRLFEARGWWILRSREAPDDARARVAIERLDKSLRAKSPPWETRTLADMLARSDTKAESPPAKASAALRVPTFVDDAESAGLRFVYENDPTPLRRLPETMGGGVGLIDYDGDGWLDVYAVQGGRFPSGSVGPAGGDRLFRNRGDGTFEDTTDRAGISSFARSYGHGVAVGDYDNDGRPDLFVTRWRSYALYHNKGDGTFEDVTESAGLGGSRGWPTSAAFADLDNDGDLDLYVCHYLAWDPETSPPCTDRDRPGKYLYCVPRAFEAEPDHVFRNDRGRFVDVTEEAGIVDKDGRGLGVVIADLDDDGRVDIFVANDMSANLLFHNLGGFRFEEVGVASGAAANAEGGYQAGMGVACGDVDGDGRPDLAVTNFYGESTTLFQNLGKGMFADRTLASNLAAPTRYVLGFGAWFFDANNDGKLDLAQANGHVNDYSPSIPFAMPAQLFLGKGNGRFVESSERAGACWKTPRVARGMAVGDLDNDGLLDVVILLQGGPLAFFRNKGTDDRASGEHSLSLRLEGTKANRDAVGAQVRLIQSGGSQSAQRLGGGSFLSACDGRLHFGLGDNPGALSVEIRWPTGHVDRYEGLKAGAGYHLIEGDAQAKLLRGWSRPR